MTTIKTSCPVCGDVELTPEQMRLVVCSRSDWSFYAFRCGTCKDEIRKPADEEVVTLLVSGGVVGRAVGHPRGGARGAPRRPITYDDVLDFALSLDRIDLLAALITPRVQA